MNHVSYPELKVYVGCALTHASEDFKKQVEEFKQELRNVCEVLCFLDIGEATPNAVYQHDIHNCVMQSDLLVAITDQPSTGLGYEMATQTEARRKPLLAIAHEDSIVSDLILDTRQPGFRFIRYKNLHTDVIPVIQNILAEIWAEHGHLPLFPSSPVDENAA